MKEFNDIVNQVREAMEMQRSGIITEERKVLRVNKVSNDKLYQPLTAATGDLNQATQFTFEKSARGNYGARKYTIKGNNGSMLTFKPKLLFNSVVDMEVTKVLDLRTPKQKNQDSVHAGIDTAKQIHHELLGGSPTYHPLRIQNAGPGAFELKNEKTGEVFFRIEFKSAMVQQ